MNRKLFLIIGFLSIVVIAASIFIINQFSSTEVLKQELAKIQKQSDKQSNPIANTSDQINIVGRKQRPTNASMNGHWHNGEWHDAPHTDLEKAQLFELSRKYPPPDTATDMTDAEIKELYGILEKYGLDGEKLSPKQVLYLSKVGVSWDLLTPEQQRLSELYHYEKNGLNPPPEGYKYVFKDLGVPKLDENGDAIIHKIGDREATKSFGGYLRESSNK